MMSKDDKNLFYIIKRINGLLYTAYQLHNLYLYKAHNVSEIHVFF